MPKRGWSTKAFFLFQVLPPITFDTVMSGGGVLVMCWCAGVLVVCWYGELLVMCWYSDVLVCWCVGGVLVW